MNFNLEKFKNYLKENDYFDCKEIKAINKNNKEYLNLDKLIELFNEGCFCPDDINLKIDCIDCKDDDLVIIQCTKCWNKSLEPFNNN